MKKSLIFPLFLIITLFSGEIYAKMSSKEYIQKAKKELPKECIFFFKMYLNAKSPKAFAYASDDNIKYTCRFSSATTDEKKAKEVALASCEKSRRKRGIKSECRLYNIDLKGFVSKREFDFRNKYQLSLKKIEKELKELKAKIEAKKTIKNKELKKVSSSKPKINVDKKLLSKLPPACHMFFKLYNISPPNRAFAVAIDSDKKYVCKFSANAKTIKKAKEVALNSCKKSKIKREVKKECSIFDIYQSKIVTDKKSVKKPKKKIALTKTHKKEEIKKVIKPIKPTLKVTKNKKIYKRVRDKELEKAILDTNLKEIKRLIKNGADVNTEADDHSRALFVATAKGDIKFVKELLDMGADPYFKKGDGNNLLVAAIMSGKLDMLKLILDAGVDPNEQCNEGNTPLHFAFMMFDDKMMIELYKHGALDNIPNDKGETVESMAKSYNVNLDKLKNYRDQN